MLIPRILSKKKESRERFVKLSHQIFEELSRTAKRHRCPLVFVVYLALLYHCNSQGWCFPGYKRIMELSGIRGKATIARALQILKKEGFITISPPQGRKGTNRYLLGSISEPKSSIIELLKFNFRTPKVQNLNHRGSKFEPKLYPINYNQLTIPNELNIGEGKIFPSPKERFFSSDYYRDWKEEGC
ncbi:MAG: helix-turn-helix domain-containing protein [Candidatus Caldatribacteriaceae bacterium]